MRQLGGNPPPLLGAVSTANSTTTALTGAATYTGTWEDCSQFGSISINATADVAGTIYADFSADASATDRTVTLSTGTDGDFGIHSLIPVNRYFRVRVVNGAGAQATMKVETMLFRGARIAMPTSRLGQNLTQFADVLNVRVGNNETLDEARGVIGERTSENIFGRNVDVGTGGEEDIWDAGGDYNFLQAAVAVRIKSGGNAADTAAGAGAQEVTIYGLDENWAETSEAVATAGASASAATTTTFIRVNHTEVTQVGTYGVANTATIDIETTGGVLVNEILTDYGHDETGVHSVPAGQTMYITRIRIVVGGTNKTATVSLMKRERADDVATPFGPVLRVLTFDEVAGGTEETMELESYIKVLEKSDVWFRGIAFTASAKIDVSMDYILVTN